MFGRRRHAAAVPAAPAPQLTEEKVFELVHRQLAAFVGAEGEWSVTRRTETDTDAIFHGVLVNSLTTDIVEALREARVRLEDATATPAAVTEIGTADEPGQHAASEEPAQHVEAALEPAAFGWEPAPITVWADLRRPVTGEIRQVPENALVA